MPVSLHIVNPSDAVEPNAGSYKNQMVRQFDGSISGTWYGRGTIPSSGTVASVDIKRYHPQIDIAPNGALILPANALVTRLAMKVTKPLTFAAVGDKLKLGIGLTDDTAGLSVTSAAAGTAGAFAAMTSYAVQSNIATPVATGASEVTFKLYATGGETLGDEVASTVTAAVDTDVLVCVSFKVLDVFLDDDFVFKKPRQLTSNNYV